MSSTRVLQNVLLDAIQDYRQNAYITLQYVH